MPYQKINDLGQYCGSYTVDKNPSTDRQADGQTDRQRDRRMDGQGETATPIHPITVINNN